MKILFVCHANVGRSQVAQVYFDKLSETVVKPPGLSSACMME
jgi:protein-tyrosine-phosphatase